MERQNAFNFDALEQEMINPLFGHKLTELEEFISIFLLDATSENPRNNPQIRAAAFDKLGTKVTERQVKDAVRELRKNHAFPILARRKKPTGYWWCHSESEMDEFIQLFKAQALDELHTLGRIVRNNYQSLAGQLNFDKVMIENDGEFEN